MKIHTNHSRDNLAIDGRLNSTNEIFNRNKRPRLPLKKKFEEMEYGNATLINIKDSKIVES